jgi:hypothetical protein
MLPFRGPIQTSSDCRRLLEDSREPEKPDAPPLALHCATPSPCSLPTFVTPESLVVPGSAAKRRSSFQRHDCRQSRFRLPRISAQPAWNVLTPQFARGWRRLSIHIPFGAAPVSSASGVRIRGGIERPSRPDHPSQRTQLPRGLLAA